MTEAKQTPPIEPLAYTVVQTCARLNFSRTTFYKEADFAGGDLETFTIGDRRYTTDEGQRRYLERKQRQSKAA